MSVPAAWPQVLDFFGMPIVIEPSPGRGAVVRIGGLAWVNAWKRKEI